MVAAQTLKSSRRAPTQMPSAQRATISCIAYPITIFVHGAMHAKQTKARGPQSIPPLAIQSVRDHFAGPQHVEHIAEKVALGALILDMDSSRKRRSRWALTAHPSPPFLPHLGGILPLPSPFLLLGTYLYSLIRPALSSMARGGYYPELPSCFRRAMPCSGLAQTSKP